LKTANELGIGPMGFGGKTTLLGVKICAANRLPASFFVSISYMCWAYRRQGVTLDAEGKLGNGFIERQIAPFFEEFRLAPSQLNEGKIRLEWKEKGSDAYFNAASLSDGTLRFLCLTTLLLQPKLPMVVLLDEPELGLHPAAVTLLADLLSSAATRTQVIVATQSVTLVNQFEPDSVWAVDRQDNQSVFRHLSQADMTTWLDDYGLGELWEKNVLGARP
jgi:ATPase subunit of ABC transporter with duplicated ATPase domains